jgi:hypothetical protein
MDINNPLVAGRIAAICAGYGHKIVETPVSADVAIVESRAQVFDHLGMGRAVIQFIWSDRFQSAEELKQFDRFKGRVFVCRDNGGPYGGVGSILLALTKIQPR